MVSGTVSREGVPRLLHLDGYDLQLEMPFTENLLLVKVNDQPGAIAGITAALADGVNIGSISLGRGVEPAEGSVVRRLSMCARCYVAPFAEPCAHERRSPPQPVALAVITVDGAVPSQVVRTIQDMDMTRFAAFAGLGEQPAAVVATEGRPLKKPASPNFCSGPTKKRPGYVVGNLRTTPFGRSHRAPIGKNRLKKAISDSKRLLGVPEVCAAAFAQQLRPAHSPQRRVWYTGLPPWHRSRIRHRRIRDGHVEHARAAPRGCVLLGVVWQGLGEGLRSAGPGLHQA